MYSAGPPDLCAAIIGETVVSLSCCNLLAGPLLEQRREEKRVHLMSKIIADEIAIPKEDYLNPATTRTRRRNTHKFAVYSVNTKEYQMSFSPRMVVDWNQCSQVNVDTICAAAEGRN